MADGGTGALGVRAFGKQTSNGSEEKVERNAGVCICGHSQAANQGGGGHSKTDLLGVADGNPKDFSSALRKKSLSVLIHFITSFCNRKYILSKRPYWTYDFELSFYT